MSPEAAPTSPSHDTNRASDTDMDVTEAIYRVIQTMGGEQEEPGATTATVNTAAVEQTPFPADEPYVEKLLHRILQLPFRTCVRLAAGWDRGPRSPEEIESMIRNSEIGELYPELAVSATFPSERPSVLFLPPDLRRYRYPADPSSHAMKRFIEENSLDATPLLDAQETARLIHFLQHNFPREIDSDDRQRVLCQIVQSFMGNLELHRLTKNPNGMTIRFSDTPIEDLDGKTYRLDQKALGYIGMLHERLYGQFRSHWITWWHRANIDPREPSSQSKLKRPIITSSLRELEVGHFISLDLICDSAIVAIRKQPPTS